MGRRRGRNGDRNPPQGSTETAHGKGEATPPGKRGGKGGSRDRIGKPDHDNRTGKRAHRATQTPPSRTERERVTNHDTKPRHETTAQTAAAGKNRTAGQQEYGTKQGNENRKKAWDTSQKTPPDHPTA
ncbi:MAG: hypothetical protein BWK73_18780 [Thiothrix lacustris]|uniref:Uncharacterized protein n=1 Tax=Thiothrix lacustris TaxID=525917 RepID=A0A1Y1QPY3_9GAMM|nr:MAG: hypothetical protein BWK73_18780 [Thiothrix lacustris]